MKQFLSVLVLFFSISLVAQKNNLKDVEFNTSDNVKIRASYQLPSVKTDKIPAIILIHQGGSKRQEWIKLPIFKKLLDQGYALLAYDVRMHGESDKDSKNFYDIFNNPNRAPLDLLAVVEFLKKDSKIDAKRIGILGASIGGNLACVGASVDKFNIKSAVSMSAKTSAVQNLSGLKDDIKLKNIFYIASKEEQGGKRDFWSNEMFKKTSGYRKVEVASGNKHGSYIIKENPYLEEEIINWFKKTL